MAFIFLGAGAILWAFLYDKGGAPTTGSAGRGPGGGVALGSSGSANTLQPSARPGSTPSVSALSGVFSSALALARRGASAAEMHRTSWQRSELRIARGTIVDRLASGVVLDCDRWVVQSASGGVYAGDGVGMNPLYANVLDARERLAFGRLMAVEHGTLRPSSYAPAIWSPESYLMGPVLVEGYPVETLAAGRSGNGFKVVVAPDGSTVWHGQGIPVYTARVTIEAEAPGTGR